VSERVRERSALYCAIVFYIFILIYLQINIKNSVKVYYILMLSENVATRADNYSEKCERMKTFFLNDEQFINVNKNKYNNKNNVMLNKNNIVNKSLSEFMCSFCHVNADKEVVIDFRYFKLLSTWNGFDTDIMIQHVMNVIETALKYNEIFIMHMYLKSLGISDMEKYYPFIVKISETFKNMFADKLEKCFIYKPPFIFAQLFNIVSAFFDKKTISKLQTVI
jgi:hypothetical protein